MYLTDRIAIDYKNIITFANETISKLFGGFLKKYKINFIQLLANQLKNINILN